MIKEDYYLIKLKHSLLNSNLHVVIIPGVLRVLGVIGSEMTSGVPGVTGTATSLTTNSPLDIISSIIDS